MTAYKRCGISFRLSSGGRRPSQKKCETSGTRWLFGTGNYALSGCRNEHSSEKAARPSSHWLRLRHPFSIRSMMRDLHALLHPRTSSYSQVIASERHGLVSHLLILSLSFHNYSQQTISLRSLPLSTFSGPYVYHINLLSTNNINPSILFCLRRMFELIRTYTEYTIPTYQYIAPTSIQQKRPVIITKKKINGLHE